MDYKQIVEDAKKNLKELVARRDEIDREMQALMRIIEGAQIIAQPSEPAGGSNKAQAAPDNKELAGVTRSVRTMLQRSREPLLPTEIRDALEVLGVEGSSSKNFLIHVHNVLRRLYENDEIEQVPRDGKMAYRVLTPMDMITRSLQLAWYTAPTKNETRQGDQAKKINTEVGIKKSETR